MSSDPVAALTLRPSIIEALSTIFDPEIPVNIYELGLIYDIDVDAENRVQVRMTLTAPACPSAQSLPLEVERKVRAVAGVKDVYVEVVWEPAWSTDRMSDEAKLQLGMW
jgi:FeS assembly SUF system protein